MKFIASLALVMAMAGAVTIEAETKTEVKAEAETATKIETSAEASTEVESGVSMVPEDYYNAVQNFDLSKPFTDQDCFKKQVDIYSDQIIAIEALRVEVMKLDYAITQAENDQRASE